MYPVCHSVHELCPCVTHCILLGQVRCSVLGVIISMLHTNIRKNAEESVGLWRLWYTIMVKYKTEKHVPPLYDTGKSIKPKCSRVRMHNEAEIASKIQKFFNNTFCELEAI